MQMKIKKLGALLVLVALCAGMAAPAFAYGGEPVEEVEQPVLTSTTDEEDCQKEFIPTSNRQIFCSKDCCYQARQDKTKADREAEKGNHYYRQRVCAVCGSTYWPTHSQQKFCSAECKKVNHNKKTLEFYYKKQKEKELCKDLLQTKEQVSDTNSSEITIIPA